MLLAATGIRAVEALSIRIKDIDFDSNPAKLFVRGEYTKTKVDRTIFLTNLDRLITSLLFPCLFCNYQSCLRQLGADFNRDVGDCSYIYYE